MDYIFVPLKADNIVMQSSLQFTKALEEELVARKNCNLKGTWLFWNMVDRRGRKDLYDAWNRVIDKMGLRLLSSHIPNTLRYNREADPVCKGVFRSTLFPPDPHQEHVVDTTGAGDTFCGAVLSRILELGTDALTEKDIREMLLFANAAASIVVTRKGALCSMPEPEEIRAASSLIDKVL